MLSIRRCVCVLLLCALLACTLLPRLTAEIIEIRPEPTQDDEPWVRPLTLLVQRILRLPYTSGSPTRALDLIRTFRTSGPLEARDDDAEFEWGYRVPTARISRMEGRSYPDSLDIQHSRPMYTPTISTASPDPHSPTEGDDEGPAMPWDEIDDGMDEQRPRIQRPSLLHALAARGFSEALYQILDLIPEDQRTEYVNYQSRLMATMYLTGTTPLHLLALYAPDTPPTPPTPSTTGAKTSKSASHGNVRAAQILIEAGANFTAGLDKEPYMAPIVFAGERGHIHVFRYLLSLLPSSYFLSWEETPRTSSESSELAEWRAGLTLITREHDEGTRMADATPEEWNEYIAWYHTHRPRTKQEKEKELLQEIMMKTLMVSAMSNRLDVVRTLLEGPGDGYGLRSRLNERAFEGRGDCLLHGLITHGLLDMAELLLQHGADLTILTHDNLTSIQLAIQYKQMDMHAFIEKKLKQIRPAPKGVRLPEHAQQQEAATTAAAAKSQPAAKAQPAKEQQQKVAPKASAHDDL